jgi:hypothetical protein
MEILVKFLTLIESDPRIGPVHISLFVALWKKWIDNGYKQPLSFFRRDLVSVCKIAGFNTYHTSIRDLHEYGYIRYLPSYDPYRGSLVYLNS